MMAIRKFFVKLIKKYMNILFPTHHFTDDPRSGIEAGIWNFPKHLAKNGHKIFVVTCSLELFNESKKSLRKKNIFIYQIYNFKTHGLGYTESFMTFVFSFFLRFFYKFDWVFLVDESKSPFSYFKFGAKLASRILTPRNKSMETFFNSGDWLYDKQRKDVGEGWDERKLPFLYKIFRFIAIRIWFKLFPVYNIHQNVDILFCEGKNTFFYYNGREKINAVYLPLGVENNRFDSFRGDVERNYNDFIFLFIGRILKMKGIYYLIESFKRLLKKYPNMKLWIIGNAFGEYKENLLRDIQGFEDRIILLGKKSRKDVVRYMKSSDVVVDPMIWANFSSVALEALYCKKPLIAPLGGNSKDFVVDGISGFLVDSRNINDLTEKMEFFYLNQDEAKEMGKRGFSFVDKYLVWEKVVKIVENNLIFFDNKQKIKKLNRKYENYDY